MGYIFLTLKKVLLSNKWVGDGFPCYFIAEIGGLFRNFEEAKKLIDSALEIGIDSIKFQTYEAETITTKKNYFNLQVTGNILQYDFFKMYEPSKDLQMKIARYANEHNITIFSAPSHIKDLELIKKMDMPIIKIGSDLACHIPLLEEVAKLKKPIILSTGMCTMEEVRDSVNTILSAGNDQLVLLHCVSDYPAKIEETNLNAILSMKKEFDLPVGFSDHTIGIMTSVAASILGANIIEKHFRDPTNPPLPDDPHSLVKQEFAELIKSVRIIEAAKGSGIKNPSKSELKNLESNRVSIVTTTDIPSNTIITKDMIDIRRPGTGIKPIHFQKVLGKRTRMAIPKEEPLTWNMLE